METKERIYTLTFFGNHTIDVIERNGRFYVGPYSKLTDQSGFYIVGIVTFNIDKLDDWKSALEDLIASGINYKLDFNRKQNNMISLTFYSKQILIRDVVLNLVAFDYFDAFQDIINKYANAVEELKFDIRKQKTRDMFNILEVQIQSDDFIDTRMTLRLDSPFEIINHIEYAMKSTYKIKKFSAQAQASYPGDYKIHLTITRSGADLKSYTQYLVCMNSEHLESLYTKRPILVNEDTTFWTLTLVVLKDKVKLPNVDPRFEVKFDGDLSKLTVLHVTPRDVLEKNPHIDDIITALT